MFFSQCIQGKSRRIFLDEGDISKHLFCPICHEVFEQPQRLFCGHTFCHACILNWANVNKKCPMCKELMFKRKLERDLIAYKMVEELRVSCSHKNCRWEGLNSILKKHERKCQHRPHKNSFEPLNNGIVEISDNDSEIK